MNELALSNDINRIETEIQFYKEKAGESIWEIGRRLDHVKNNDLAHGEFRKWHESIGIDKDFAYKSMRISKELPNVETLRHLGSTALDLIATIPHEERDLEHVTADGETKRPDEMTVRELQELKKQLKEKEKQIEQAQRSEQIALDLLEREQNKEPIVIEKEVVPEDFRRIEYSEKQLKAENRRLGDEIARLERLERDTEEVKRIEVAIEKLNKQKEEVNRVLDANDKLSELEKEFETFFDSRMAPIKYKPLVNELQLFNGTERMKTLVNLARAWVDDMDHMLPSEHRKIIEGEIIND